MKFRKSVKGIVFRTVISMIITFCLAVNGRDVAWVAVVIKQPAFYLSLVVSFPVTLAIVYWIHRLSLFLDEKYDWRSRFFKRSLFQMLLGLIVPVGFDLLFVFANALFDPNHFSLVEFFRFDFLVVVILIVVINLIYVVRSLLSEPKGKAKQEPITLDKSPTILVRYGKQTKKLDIKQDILYFYLARPNVIVVTSEREYSLGKGTITNMEKLYSTVGFCRISSRTVVNMSIVKDLLPTKIRNNFKIEFFDPSIIPNPDCDNLLVKGEYRQRVNALLGKE